MFKKLVPVVALALLAGPVFAADAPATAPSDQSSTASSKHHKKHHNSSSTSKSKKSTTDSSSTAPAK
jgi:hypothetical protein